MISLRVGVAVAFVVFGAIAAIVTLLGSPPADRATIAVMVPAFVVPPLVGGLILVRRPENRIGWLFCLIGFGLAATMSVGTVSGAMTNPPIPTWALLAVWVGQFLYLLFIIPSWLVIMTFPTGRLPSRRWRPVVVALIAGGFVTAIGTAFGREQLEVSGGAGPLNPFAAPEPLRSILLTARDAGDLVSILLLLPTAAAVVIRMRRAEGVERLQLKWFAYAVAMLTLVVPATSLLLPSEVGLQWGLAALGFGAALPAAAGIAILRYRLYDIDVVIRRTLVYGAVVAILGATYVAMVLGLQALLRDLTGGETIPVALSTVTIAALFGPLRRRVREAVDRRFYRSRYDTQRILETFGARLRDEVALDSVSAALADTAGRTVRPASTGVWIRKRPA